MHDFGFQAYYDDADRRERMERKRLEYAAAASEAFSMVFGPPDSVDADENGAVTIVKSGQSYYGQSETPQQTKGWEFYVNSKRVKTKFDVVLANRPQQHDELPF